ncbi:MULTISPECIES: phage tail protein [Aquimarina]|uniref:Phage tail protein n=1 Tax=Aquimarina rubra TaxID=1920033 RepID=A0ABW5LHD0_9FLAO
MEGTIGEIRMFAGNFAPRTWAFCDGQLLAINSNQALFSILGTTYGGDGRTTFGLPDLRGRVPISPGNGPGLTPRNLGQRSGTETNVLTTNQLPAHSHTGSVKVSSANATESTPTANGSVATPGTGSGRSFSPTLGFNAATPDVTLNSQSVQTTNTGGNQSVNNMQPWLGIYYIICLQGIFPSRN